MGPRERFSTGLRAVPHRLVLTLLTTITVAISFLLQGSYVAHAPESLGGQLVALFQNGGSDLTRALPQLGQASTSAEASLDEARRARLDGAYEEAAHLYSQVLESRGPDRAALAMASAEAYLAASDARNTLAMANRALAEDPSSSDAYLLQAEAWWALGDAAQALNAIRQHVALNPLRGYGAFRAAEISAVQQDFAGARAWYQQALDLGLNRLWATIAARRIGASYLADGEVPAAMQWLDRASKLAAELAQQGTPTWFDGELVRKGNEAGRVAILFELARAQWDAGQTSAAADTYAEVITRSPSSSLARDALQALVLLGASDRVNGYQRGLVHLNQRRYGDAIDGFSEFLVAGPSPSAAASAWYYRAMAWRGSGDAATAINQYGIVAADYPDHPLAPEALLEAARLTESTASRALAVDAYHVVVAGFPASEEAARSLLRIAVLEQAGGDLAAARDAWRQLGEHPSPRARAQGLYWLGRSQLALGDQTGARAVLDAAAEASPFSYEGLRARDLALGGLGAEPYVTQGTRILPAPPVDLAECADWVASWSGQSEVSAAGQATMARVQRLLASGLRGPALAELMDGSVDAGLSAPDRLALGRLAADSGLYAASIHIANRLAAVSPAGPDAAPACLQRMIYPMAYADQVRMQADRQGLDPFVLLSLLRQESWFNSHARSGADAYGMAQVIPGTSAEIARALGRPGITNDDMYRPREAIAFGAYYLSTQTELLNSRPLLGLAAYNGGGGSVRRWIGGNLRMDPDDFAEAIDFAETRSYVRNIYENYARYRALYG